MLIVFFGPENFDGSDIGVGRNVIFRESVVHHTAQALVVNGLFVQSQANAPDDAALELAARRLGVQNLPCAERADI